MALLESQKSELQELERRYPVAETCYKCVHGKPEIPCTPGGKCFSCVCISLKNKKMNFEEEKE